MTKEIYYEKELMKSALKAFCYPVYQRLIKKNDEKYFNEVNMKN
jgi:hypothetical protein